MNNKNKKLLQERNRNRRNSESKRGRRVSGRFFIRILTLNICVLRFCSDNKQKRETKKYYNIIFYYRFLSIE